MERVAMDVMVSGCNPERTDAIRDAVGPYFRRITEADECADCFNISGSGRLDYASYRNTLRQIAQAVMRANGEGCEVEIVVNWLQRPVWAPETGATYEPSVRMFYAGVYEAWQRTEDGSP